MIETHSIRRGDDVIVQLTGELDVFASWRLVEAVEDELRAGAKRIAIDVGSLVLCDSSGVSALVRAAHLCHAFGVQLRVQGANGIVQRVLEWSRVDELVARDAIGQGASVKP
jgi:anti-sigma B factor antagonist